MKYYMVEGTIKNQEAMNDDILKEHMACTKKVMD